MQIEIKGNEFRLCYDGGNKSLHLGVLEDGFFQIRKNEAHFFKMIQGFGMNLLLLKKLEELYPATCKGIKIIYFGKKRIYNYYSVPRDWFEKGERYANKISPFDEQVLLSIRNMEEKVDR